MHDYPNNSNIATVSLMEITLVFIFVALVTLFYFHFDPDIMLRFEVFPWDSASYRRLAENLYSNNTVYETNPFAYRILFPWLYGAIHNITGLSYIYSSLALNIFSSWIVLIISYILWRKSNSSRVISLVGLVYFSVSWIGPIRHSIFYPGGGFAFEVMLVLLFFLIITRVQKGGLFTLVISIVTIFLLGLGREFITYMALFITTLHLIIKSIQYKPKSQNGILFHIATKLESRDTLSLLLISASSVLSYIYVRSLVHAQGNNNITIDSIVTQGWFHLHIAEFIYPFFYAFGVVALILFAIILLKNSRIILFKELKNSVADLDILFFLCICAIIFAMLGGTDSDRFLLWFFPYFSLFALKGVNVMIMSRHRKSILFILIVSALFGSRFYVPSTPYFFLPGDFYASQANVKTNYDPDLYYGPGFMEEFRLPLKDVPSSDVIIYGVKDNLTIQINTPPKIPLSIQKDSPGNVKHWYRNHYENEVNNIPFPLGFSHNQFELFAAHPSYGGVRIKIALLFQWLILLILVVLLLKNSSE
jgi:hypothetical protein